MRFATSLDVSLSIFDGAKVGALSSSPESSDVMTGLSTVTDDDRKLDCWSLLGIAGGGVIEDVGSEGLGDGPRDGPREGLCVGSVDVGLNEGLSVGCVVDGLYVGYGVIGAIVGAGVGGVVGLGVGDIVGLGVGDIVGGSKPSTTN